MPQTHEPVLLPVSARDSAAVSRPTGETELRYSIAAWSCVRYSLAEIERLRKKPPADYPAVVTPAFLKHSDEQTIASVGALVTAMRDLDRPLDEYKAWSIVAAPRFMGRTALASGMHRYEVDGPWGTSVQTIPHRSQHSVSSTLSLVLGAKGPCIGAGCGLGGDIETLLAAVTLLSSNNTPGAWVVMSGFHPELAIDRTGAPTTDSMCSAVALALVKDRSQSPIAAARGELRLRVIPRSLRPAGESGLLDTLAGLFDHVSERPIQEASLIGDSSVGVHWELDLRSTAAAIPRAA